MGTVRGPRRVVHLVLSLNIGGLEMVVLDLVRHTDRRAFEPCVLCLSEVGALGPAFAAAGVPVESLNLAGRSSVRRVLLLARWLRRVRPHVLHTHNPSPHVAGALAARLAGVPVVVHTKHGRNKPADRRAVAWNRLAARLTDHVVAVSEDAADVARRVERVPASKVRVIHNGIDLAVFHPPAAPDADGMRAIHVARLIGVKDQATLLRAVRRVVDREPRFRLEILGDGPAREALTRLRQDLGLEQHVHFLGFRSDVGAHLQAADLFVLSSVSEGVSLTLLEAMACGLPVVATDAGGNREVVVPGGTGVLVPPGRPELLADAVLGLLHDRDRARAMGRAGRRRVEESFDLRRVVAAYERLYAGPGPDHPAGESPRAD